MLLRVWTSTNKTLVLYQKLNICQLKFEFTPKRSIIQDFELKHPSKISIKKIWAQQGEAEILQCFLSCDRYYNLSSVIVL